MSTTTDTDTTVATLDADVTCQAPIDGCPNTAAWVATTTHAHTGQHCATTLVCDQCRDDLISLEAVYGAYYGGVFPICVAHDTRSDITWRPL